MEMDADEVWGERPFSRPFDRAKLEAGVLNLTARLYGGDREKARHAIETQRRIAEHERAIAAHKSAIAELREQMPRPGGRRVDEWRADAVGRIRRRAEREGISHRVAAVRFVVEGHATGGHAGTVPTAEAVIEKLVDDVLKTGGSAEVKRLRDLARTLHDAAKHPQK